MDPFTSLLLDISNQLSREQLEQMKFLCQGDIGKRDREKIVTGTELFNALIERGKLGEDNTELLSELLQNIKRQDLLDKLTQYERGPEASSEQPDPEETAKLDKAIEVIAQNLVKNWRKLGRKLGLPEVKLESIAKRHPTELDEAAMAMLKEWRKRRGAQAQTQELIKALRDCQLKLTAEKVEDSLRTL